MHELVIIHLDLHDLGDTVTVIASNVRPCLIAWLFLLASVCRLDPSPCTQGSPTEARRSRLSRNSIIRQAVVAVADYDPRITASTRGWLSQYGLPN